jgi:predicted RNA-binding Zn ribbon-like protein
MPNSAQPAFAPDAPFKYVGGDVSLDLVNTADWTERGLESDRLTDYLRVLEWARGAGVLGASGERRLREEAAAHRRRAASAYAAVRAARAVLQRVFAAVAGGRRTPGGLAELNALLTAAAGHMQLLRSPAGTLVRGWNGLGESLESVLWPVVWAGAELLASPDQEKLRICAGDDCGWMYVDRSRNGLRRWCEMSTCGTTAKNRRRSG